VIGAHLNNGRFCIGFYFQDRERHTDVVVEITFGCIGDETGPQHFVHQFLGRCLSIAAGYGDPRYVALLSVRESQLLPGLQ